MTGESPLGTLTLDAGDVVRIAGWPVRLTAPVVVETHAANVAPIIADVAALRAERRPYDIQTDTTGPAREPDWTHTPVDPSDEP